MTTMQPSSPASEGQPLHDAYRLAEGGNIVWLTATKPTQPDVPPSDDPLGAGLWSRSIDGMARQQAEARSSRIRAALFALALSLGVWTGAALALFLTRVLS